MKLINTCLRNQLGEKSISYLMKIAIESPQKLSDNDLETIEGIWTRIPRKIAVQNIVHFLLLLFIVSLKLL